MRHIDVLLVCGSGASSGFMAVKVTIAIVLGIILISELPNRMFSCCRRTHA